MSFLRLDGQTFVVFGVSNKKSVGFHVGKVLREEGAKVVYVVHTEARRDQLTAKLDAPIYVADVEDEAALAKTCETIGTEHGPLAGFVHSIAFANYSEGFKPFHETNRQDFMQAVQISCHSLVEMARHLAPHMRDDASVVTISISTTRMAAENYGYMAPVKAALDSTVVFLAKSFSGEGTKNIRFNSVSPGLLKTSSSAGIPGYVNSYLFAERATLRKKALATGEVADTVAFLLSPRSAGINAQQIVIDAGMSTNYFDKTIVDSALKGGSL
ncbi:MAG: SDR family oxidoreductase [Deltaproteobacteria bacterium]